MTAAERVARERAAQGLPPTVEDPETLAAAAAVLRSHPSFAAAAPAAVEIRRAS